MKKMGKLKRKNDDKELAKDKKDQEKEEKDRTKNVKQRTKFIFWWESQYMLLKVRITR